MSDAGYEISRWTTSTALRSTDGSAPVLRPLRRRLGFRPFGLNVWEGEQAGDQVIEPHREESGDEELYVVVRGAARFTLGEETFDAPHGHARARAARHVPRRRRPPRPGTIVLACRRRSRQGVRALGLGGRSTSRSRCSRDGRCRGGRARSMDEALAREPDAWQGQYNAACFEALAGETDAAFEHLRRAIAMNRDGGRVRRRPTTTSRRCATTRATRS